MAEKYIYATAAADPGAKAKGKESRGFRDTRSREKAAMENNSFERLRPMLDNLPAQWFSYSHDYFYIYENHSYEDYTVLKKIRITDKNRSAIIKLREAFENGIYRNAGSIDSLLDVFRRGNGRHNRHNIGFGETGTGRRNDGVAVRKPNGDDFRYPRENSRFDKGAVRMEGEYGNQAVEHWLSTFGKTDFGKEVFRSYDRRSGWDYSDGERSEKSSATDAGLSDRKSGSDRGGVLDIYAQNGNPTGRSAIRKVTADTSEETKADSDGSAFSDGKGSRDIASLENLHEINDELRTK